jgi:hypothetical protein
LPAQTGNSRKDTYIRDRETAPDIPLTGEAVGEYVAQLLAGAGPEIHERSIELRSAEQLAGSV